MKPLFRQFINSSRVHVALMTTAIAGLTITAFRVGLFEPLELRAYDAMFRLQPDRKADPRLLIVGISETDLHRFQTTTPSDRTVAQAMKILQKHQPRVMGIDLYRDLPQGKGQALLQKQFQASNVIAIHRIGDRPNNFIPAPPQVPPERVGFNDVPIDNDGVVRRALIFAGQDTSFAMQIAFTYLEKEGIVPQESQQYPGILQLGQSTFLPIASNSGAYRTIDARGHQIFLNYRTPTIARKITLSQVLDQKFDPALVRDKIVLIGTVAISSKDFFYTPYSPNQQEQHQMSGVELQAQIISQILDAPTDPKSLIGSVPSWAEWLWIIGCSVLSSLLAWTLRDILQLELANAVVLISIAGTGVFLFHQGCWIPIVAPLIAAITSHVYVIAYRTQILARQNRMAITLLGQNTSKAVAKALWDNRHGLIQSGQLPGQAVTATLLFTDLKGFSTLAEKLEPEQMMALLNEYLGAMTEEVHRYDGIVNKFTGDGLFAAFGVPIPSKTEHEIAEDAKNAVRCAIAMRQRLEELNQAWCDRQLNPVAMRVGISTGTVVVGSLGSKERIEYGIIGDSANVASRLESCLKERQAEECRILISQATQQYLGDQFKLTPWGAVNLHGREQPVKVYRVIKHS